VAGWKLWPERGWPLAAISPDTTGTQAPGKGVPAWSEAQQQVKKVLGDGFVEQLNQAMKRVSKGAAAS
jgi:hypothetical protein